MSNVSDRPFPAPEPLAEPLPSVSRRQAALIMAAGLGAGLLGPSTLFGQPNRGLPGQGKPGPAGQPSAPAGQPGIPGTAPSATPAQILPSFLDNVLVPGKSKDRTLRVRVVCQSWQQDPNTINPNTTTPYQHRTFTFQKGAVVFPVIAGTSMSTMDTEAVSGELQFEDKTKDSTPEFNDNYPSGTRLGVWRFQDLSGREFSLQVELPMTSFRVKYDEALAMKATWPNKWGKIGQSTFSDPQVLSGNRPLIDWRSSEVNALVSGWTEGKDPKTIPPAQLAKYLTSKCVEMFQEQDSGVSFLRTGGFEGVDIEDSPTTIRRKRGSQHDIAVAVCAIFRAAGLPTRTVIGWDVTEKRGETDTPFEKSKGSGELRSWVEFCLYDEKSDREFWIPVDVVQQRKKSSRARSLTDAWQFFGNNDDGDQLLPFAFQYHPPTSVIAYGRPCFWGWIAIPRIEPAATQFALFTERSTAKRPAPKGKPGSGR